MSNLPVLLLLLSLIPQGFSRFSYCRESSRGLFELQCVDLDAAGKGDVRLKRRDTDATAINIELSPAALTRFLSVIAGTNNLEQGDAYESNRKVADLGKKRLVIDMPSGQREAIFNYSSRKEVIDLAAFFDSLINQETLISEMDTALRFERLSVPQRLEQIESELRSNRIADPERLIPTLEKIEGDQRLLNFARTRAGRMKTQIQTKK